MGKDLISVIIPVYKVEKYLDKCVESVVNQSYKNLEIILVDDGSPDNCPAMCDEWAKKDKRIIVYHKKNTGVAETRNFGLKKAKGDFIAFIDSDDFIEKEYLEKLYNSIKENKTKISFCRYKQVYSDKDIFVNEKYLQTGEITREFINSFFIMNSYQKNNIVINENTMGCIWRCLFLKEIITDVSFDDLRCFEDNLFLAKVFKKTTKISVVDEYLYNYLCRENSLTKEFNINTLKLYKEYLRLFEIHWTSFIEENVIKAYYFYMYKSLIIKALECNDLKSAKKIREDDFFRKLNKSKNYQEQQKQTNSLKRKVSNFLIHKGLFKLYIILNRK